MVNKLSEIDNTYRNFSFEVLAGSKDTMVRCKENNCQFVFDFATVYWNPRLSSEHERVVDLITSSDVVYDVFAGVGPFSIPAVSQQRCKVVLANDLNPNSYRFLLENYRINNKSKLKLKEQEFRKTLFRNEKSVPTILCPKDKSIKFDPSQNFIAFNLDGREFIRNKVKYHFAEMLNYELKKGLSLEDTKYYVLMNLPAISTEFLDSFINLYTKDESELIKKTLGEDLIEKLHLNIFCYHFVKSTQTDLDTVKTQISNEILKDPKLKIESKYVRRVAPNKDMYCSMMKLKLGKLFYNENHFNENIQNGRELESPPSKIQRLE